MKYATARGRTYILRLLWAAIFGNTLQHMTKRPMEALETKAMVTYSLHTYPSFSFPLFSSEM